MFRVDLKRVKDILNRMQICILPLFSGIDTPVSLNSKSCLVPLTHHAINKFELAHLNAYIYSYGNGEKKVLQSRFCSISIGKYKYIKIVLKGGKKALAHTNTRHVILFVDQLRSRITSPPPPSYNSLAHTHTTITISNKIIIINEVGYCGLYGGGGYVCSAHIHAHNLYIYSYYLCMYFITVL